MPSQSPSHCLCRINRKLQGFPCTAKLVLVGSQLLHENGLQLRRPGSRSHLKGGEGRNIHSGCYTRSMALMFLATRATSWYIQDLIHREVYLYHVLANLKWSPKILDQ